MFYFWFLNLIHEIEEMNQLTIDTAQLIYLKNDKHFRNIINKFFVLDSI